MTKKSGDAVGFLEKDDDYGKENGLVGCKNIKKKKAYQ